MKVVPYNYEKSLHFAEIFHFDKDPLHIYRVIELFSQGMDYQAEELGRKIKTQELMGYF